MNETTHSTKVCTHCKRVLPISKFNKSSKSSNGLQCWCKDCMHEANEMRKLRNMAKCQQLSTNLFTKPEEIKIDKPDMTKDEMMATFTSRELLAEIKKSGYVWTNMYIKQTVCYDKI